MECLTRGGSGRKRQTNPESSQNATSSPRIERRTGRKVRNKTGAISGRRILRTSRAQAEGLRFPVLTGIGLRLNIFSFPFRFLFAGSKLWVTMKCRNGSVVLAVG